MKFKNNAGQEYEVVSRRGKRLNGSMTYLIRFTKTGYERVIEKVETQRGKIKDRLEPSVCGIGILGEVKMVDYKKEYTTWSGMLERCYDKGYHSYHNYGGKGYTVHEDWHLFTNFLRDIEKIDGFDRERYNSNLLHLDKDKKQNNEELKVYSLDTCSFLTIAENNALKNHDHRKKKFYGMSPEGKIVEILGLKDFARRINIPRQGISSCLAGRSNTTKGWKFKYKLEELI